MKKRSSRSLSWKVWLPAGLVLSAVLGFALAILLAPLRKESIPQIPLETAGTLPTEAPETEPPTEATEPEWYLAIANTWNPLPEDFQVPELTQLRNGQSVDSRCYPELQKMMDDCRAQGLEPLIVSSFRTWDKQQALYDNKVERVMKEGYSYEEALVEAARVVAVPGTSEHQLGLSLDIVDENHIVLDETQEDTQVQKWLMENSWRYGFILRYPKEKSDITGIIYEPWHYRYVGGRAAMEIYEQGLCLEEYLGKTDHAVG